MLQSTIEAPKQHRFTWRAARRLGAVSLPESIQVVTNDAAAMLAKKMHSRATWSSLHVQMREEFSTDLSERFENANFANSFIFDVEGDDLRAVSTGQSMRQLTTAGYETAKRDQAMLGTDFDVKVAAVRLANVERIVDWYNSDSSKFLVESSLAPEEAELPYSIARKLNYRPERAMSSNCVYERTSSGQVVMHAFSLDGHSLHVHNQVLRKIGEDKVDSTVDCLQKPVTVSADSLQQVRSMFVDAGATYAPKILSADEQQRENHAFELWQKTHQALERALLTQNTTEIVSVCREYSVPYRFDDNFSFQDARKILEYMRSTTLPYIVLHGSRGQSIKASAAQATNTGFRSEGSCPSASGVSYRNEASSASSLPYHVRSLQAAELKQKRSGYGECIACQSNSFLYGCGVFCRGCNDVWCDEYSRSGKQLEPKQIKQKRGYFWLFLA